MAGARAAVGRRKASALRSARAASDDAAQALRLPALCLPLFFGGESFRALCCPSSDACAPRERERLFSPARGEGAARVVRADRSFFAVKIDEFEKGKHHA